MNDPFGKFGLSCLSAGYLLDVVNSAIHAEAMFYASFTCTCIGGIYYLLKIYRDFIKKSKS